MADEIFLPKYFKCDQVTFESLLAQANSILGYPNSLAESYCTPLIDKNGDYYFIVEKEVLSLVDYTLCIPFENIEFPIQP